MRRHKLYTILTIIAVFTIFTTAATCTFCGIQLDTESSEEESDIETKKEVAETNSKETGEQTDTLAEETFEQAEVEEDTGGASQETEEEILEEEDEPFILGEAATLQTERLGIVGDNSGSISRMGDVMGIIYTGDDENNDFYNAFLCFDISSLAGLNIANAQLEVEDIRKFGEPSDFAQFLYFDQVNYGDTLESMDGVYMVTEPLFSIPTNELGKSLSYSSKNLLKEVQNRIDSGLNWCQLATGFNYFSDDDNEKDGYRFLLEGLVLQINYYE